MLPITAKRILLLIACCTMYSNKAVAQLIPDNTLGAESSTIRSIDELRSAIEGGAVRGDNLFHSFQEFSINQGLNVNFVNPSGIANIFSRVTGANISEILGTLRVDGNANLFLMNPNGIVFGENAVVDVGGSFLATTAKTIDFNNGNRFSSLDPNKPSLTINFPIGLGMGSNPGDIVIRGEQNNVVVEIPSFRVNADNLPPAIQMSPGQNISLVGGNINFEGGGLQAPGGNIQLESIDSNQDIKLAQVNGWFVADSSNISNFKNIQLKNAAYVDVSGKKAGNIDLNGRQIIIDEGSVVLANSLLATDNQIKINASELLKISGTSGDFNADKPFFLIDKIAFQGLPAANNGNNYSVSLIGADMLSGSNGSGNDVNINAKSLQIFDAGQIRAVNFSQANSITGDINLNVENILVEGTNNIDSLLTSVINSSTAIGSDGHGGNVNIDSQTLRLEHGGRIKADAFGNGSGGNLIIKSDSIVLQGFTEPFLDSIFTGLSTSSLAAGIDGTSSGKIHLETKILEVLDGAKIGSNTFGKSSAGEINIQAESVKISGSVPFGKFTPSSITASVNRGKSPVTSDEINRTDSPAGSIIINTERLQVLDGGTIEAVTNRGNSGNIKIDARSIELNGTKPKIGNFIGGLSTSAQNNSFGRGGNITINTDSLKILNGSIVRSISLGDGDAGNIDINAGTIEVSGLDRFAENPAFNERVSKINTGSLKTNGGNLNIYSDSIKIDNLAILQATTQGGSKSGNINIVSNSLKLSNQSQITATAGGTGNGGNITIDSDSIIGFGNSDITANAFKGNGGNIEINSDIILGIESRAKLTPFSDITASSDLGVDGTVTINSPDTNADDEVLFSAKPTEPNQVEKLFNSSCLNPNRSRLARVILRGRGLPETPYNYFDRPSEEIETSVEAIRQPKVKSDPQAQKLPPVIIEPNAIEVDDDGRRFLVALTSEQIQSARVCQQQLDAAK